jgi:hypothetical protein
MRVTRHDVVDILLSTMDYDLEEIDMVLLNQIQLITEPHAHVSRYLVIAAAAFM